MFIRMPSPMKSLKASTTGALTRQIKRSINPLYGKKGMGFINNPSKAMYNKIYYKTTIGKEKMFRPGVIFDKSGFALETESQKRGRERIERAIAKNEIKRKSTKMLPLLSEPISNIIALIFLLSIIL